MNHGIKPVIYYCNPNIAPYDEYLHRRDECERYARSLGLEMVEAAYDHSAWLDAVAGLEHEPERGERCRRCFEVRLRSAAQYAATHGIRLVTTTLASSRWKNLEQINAAGQSAVCGLDVDFWDRNWRKGGLSERRAEIIRQYNFYNQRYCGCEFSMPPDLKEQ